MIANICDSLIFTGGRGCPMEDYLIGDFANKIMRGQISKKQAETEVVPSSSSVKAKLSLV